MFVKVSEDGSATKYSLNQLYKDNPGTSFPVPTSLVVLAVYNVYPMTRTEAPVVTYTQNVEEGQPAFVDGQWVQTWAVVDVSDEEAASRLDAKWAEVRDIRNELLAACDWTQLADAPVDAAAWATYRQALRDITAQPDPFNILWPAVP